MRKSGMDALSMIGHMDREALKDKKSAGKKETQTGSKKSSHSSRGARLVREAILDHPGLLELPTNCKHVGESSQWTQSRNKTPNWALSFGVICYTEQITVYTLMIYNPYPVLW